MTQAKEDKAKKELAEVINRNSLENLSNTPDWVLADYLFECLCSFSSATRQRDNWYGGKQSILDSEKSEKWQTSDTE
jgi:hypothetical protein